MYKTICFHQKITISKDQGRNSTNTVNAIFYAYTIYMCTYVGTYSYFVWAGCGFTPRIRANIIGCSLHLRRNNNNICYGHRRYRGILSITKIPCAKLYLRQIFEIYLCFCFNFKLFSLKLCQTPSDINKYRSDIGL